MNVLFLVVIVVIVVFVVFFCGEINNSRAICVSDDEIEVRPIPASAILIWRNLDSESLEEVFALFCCMMHVPYVPYSKSPSGVFGWGGGGFIAMFRESSSRRALKTCT